MGELKGYHAHIYFEPCQRQQAADLREEIGCLFPVLVGQIHDQPVGPHTRSMFQVAFEPSVFEHLLPWLMLNRRGLTVLVHPETGDDLVDHRDHSLWMGEMLPLDFSRLVPN